MIYVDRERIAKPEIFFDALGDLYDEIITRLSNEGKYRQSRFRLESEFLIEIEPYLKDLFNNKCCYCESSINGQTPSPSFFRPVSSVTFVKGKDNQGYYWLSYTWFNLYLSCPACEKSKGNHFPVKGSRLKSPSINTYEDYKSLQAYVKNEKAMLLDPCDSEIHAKVHFRYHDDGTLIPITEEGETSIEVLNLNRTSLVDQRNERIKQINQLLSVVTFAKDHTHQLKEIIQELHDNTTFLGLNRFLITPWFISNKKIIEEEYPDLKKRFDKAFDKCIPSLKLLANTAQSSSLDQLKPSHPFSSYKAPFMNRLQWIEIKNFKAIEEARLEIPAATSDEGENSIMLIGENGVGKSTVLQAFALAMMGQEELDKLNLGNSKKLIRRSSRAKKATIKVKFNDSEELIEVIITASGIRSNRPTLVKPVVGIGSVRRLPEKGEDVNFEDDPSRIKSLFKHDVVFPDIQPWLGNTDLVNSFQFNEAAKTIIEMLMIPEEMTIKNRLLNRKKGEVTVNVGNGAESIEEMCDGHKSVIGYALYILRCFSEHWDSAYNAEGLVLIDEIGNHLHPTWKIKVVSLLRHVFPLTTFVISTHDPLCLRSARKGEVWVMNKEQSSGKVIVAQKDIPRGISLESLLTGKWFYMDHTTDDHTTGLLQEHSAQMFSENPDKERLKTIELELENSMMLQRSTGVAKMDTVLNVINEVQKEDTTRLRENNDLRKQLAERIRNQIKK